MKSLEELALIREKALLKAQGLSAEGSEQHIRFIMTIGMATCGITAGARPVFTTLLECMTEQMADDVKIHQTGCFGKCSDEPMMSVEDEKGQVYYYGKLNPERVKEIFHKHILEGKPVAEYFVEMESNL